MGGGREEREPQEGDEGVELAPNRGNHNRVRKQTPESEDTQGRITRTTPRKGRPVHGQPEKDIPNHNGLLHKEIEDKAIVERQVSVSVKNTRDKERPKRWIADRADGSIEELETDSRDRGKRAVRVRPLRNVRRVPKPDFEIKRVARPKTEALPHSQSHKK